MAIKLFPAYAGVIPAARPELPAFVAFPRTRGGDPQNADDFEAQVNFSPHTRG